MAKSKNVESVPVAVTAADGGEKKMPVTIAPPNIRTLAMKIRGTAPYVQNKFSQKAMDAMRSKQAEGSTAVGKKKRDPKDFKACYEGAMHRSTDGWCGIPAPAFRCAAISACRLVGFQMTKAKLSIFVVADGYDATDGSSLVRISKGEPEYTEMPVRNDSGVIDIRARPMWRTWEATVRVSFDADQFTSNDVINLMMRAGAQVGVGEGRPDSKNSAGMGWGTFEIVND